MGVIFTRTATPIPGKQSEAFEFIKKRAEALRADGVDAEVRVRVGGPFAQMILISRFADMQKLEAVERKLIQDSVAGKVVQSSDHRLWDHVEDAFWLSKK